jgi:hypothetical protein
MGRKAKAKRFDLLLDQTDARHQKVIKYLEKRGRGVSVASAICDLLEKVAKEAEESALEKVLSVYARAADNQTAAIVMAIENAPKLLPDSKKANGQRSAYQQ